MWWVISMKIVSSVRSSSVYHGLLHTQQPTFPNTFAYITLTMHPCTIFFKILQGSSNICKTQHVLYFLNTGGSRISNMTFPCVMKVMKVWGYLCIFAFLSISLHFSIFLQILCILLHKMYQNGQNLLPKGTHMKFMKKLLYIGLHTFCFLLTLELIVPLPPQWCGL